jgi:hypothetical protein
MKQHFFKLLLPVLGAIGGCKDNPEQIPAYLDIKPFTVTETGPGKWQDIQEGWVYVNGDFLGAYTLPARVPALAAGSSEVLVFPGVKENGIETTPNIYDFLTRYEIQTDLKAGELNPISPSTKYKTEIFFPWALDRTTFDGSSSIVFDDRDADQATSYTLTTDGAFNGRSLKMTVDSLHPLIAIASEEAVLPTNGSQQAWLEINRRNDIGFTFYLIGFSNGGSEQQFPVYAFTTTDVWKKTYINLTEFLASSGEGKHRLYFQVQLSKDNNGKLKQQTGTVQLDNIRLVHF